MKMKSYCKPLVLVLLSSVTVSAIASDASFDVKVEEPSIITHTVTNSMDTITIPVKDGIRVATGKFTGGKVNDYKVRFVGKTDGNCAIFAPGNTKPLVGVTYGGKGLYLCVSEPNEAKVLPGGYMAVKGGEYGIFKSGGNFATVIPGKYSAVLEGNILQP